MTVYFANQNESIWDIARIYNASVDEIMNINALEDNFLKQNTMILVPLA